MSKKSTSFVVVLMLLLLAVLYFVKNSPTESQKLIASGHPDWSPIMSQQDEQIVGAGPEIVAKIFGELGVEVDSKYVGGWDIVQEKAKSGTVDVVVAAYKTPERETYMDYSIAYTVDPVILVTKKDAVFAYSKWADLTEKKGVVTIGDSYGADFDNFIAENLAVETVETPAEAFALLESQEADYFVYALYSAENYLAENAIADQFAIIPEYISSENFYLTISKKSPFVELLPEVDALLEKYAADGTIEQIIAGNK